MKRLVATNWKRWHFALLTFRREALNPESQYAHRPGYPGAVALLLVLLAGCAYFNTFYNATTYYDTGVDALATGTASGSDDIPKPARDAFGKAIEKSLKVIEQYPKSRYVDDAFFIVGRSHLYRQEYGLAERYLQQLLQEYPWSPFSDEVRIWLAKVHIQLGLNEAVEEDIAPILGMSNPPRELLTEIYTIRADMALRQGDISTAIIEFQKGAELAVDAAQQAALYHQLYILAEGQEDYAAALGFLERYTRSTTIESKRLDARLVRIQLLQKMDDLKGAYREIRNMVALTEFTSIIPGLQLELGKIELQQGNRGEALDHFMEIIEEYETLPEANEAAYQAGEIYFTDLHDINTARSQFKRVKRNTTYYQPAQVRLEQISTLEELYTKISTLQTQLGLEVDEVEKPMDEREMIRGGGDEVVRGRIEKEATTTEAGSVDTAAVRQDLAYAMYRLGEIQLFEMEDTTSGLEIMAEIASNFEETGVAAQAAYVLYVQTRNNPDQAAFWRALILEKYPVSSYGLLLSERGSITGNPRLDSLTAFAGEAVSQDPRRALDLFRKIRQQFGTEHSAFAIAYLYDEYLARLDSAIVAYDEYLTLYPDGSYSKNAGERLDFLRRIKANPSLIQGALDADRGEEEKQDEETDTPPEDEEASGTQKAPEP